jgi:hypothetical protein
VTATGRSARQEDSLSLSTRGAVIDGLEVSTAEGAATRLGWLTIVSTAVVLALAGGGAPADVRTAQNEPPFSPTHWWKANGTAKDAVGHDDGRRVHGAGYTLGVRGDEDKAFSFNGNRAEFRFDDRGGNFARNAFTLAFFIKTTSTAMQAIWEKRLVCNANSFWGFRMSDGVPGAELMSDQLGRDYVGNFSSGRNIGDGAWHHMALVRKGVKATIYIDGVLAATKSKRRAVDIWNDEPLRAGMSICVGVDGTRPFSGELDELMIFERALTQKKIQALIGLLTGEKG